MGQIQKQLLFEQHQILKTKNQENIRIQIRHIFLKRLRFSSAKAKFSVDKEHDEGKLVAHKAFWNVKDTVNLNADARLNATITEMIYVSDEVKDGDYILNLQIASFENDASPSKPVLYKI